MESLVRSQGGEEKGTGSYVQVHEFMITNTNTFLETLQEWNSFLTQEYTRELHARIPPEQVNDPKARKLAMKEFVDWHKEQIEHFADTSKHTGSAKAAVKDALKPILSLVSVFNASIIIIFSYCSLLIRQRT